MSTVGYIPDTVKSTLKVVWDTCQLIMWIKEHYNQNTCTFTVLKFPQYLTLNKF